jgi:uncharacterized Zn finger protein
VLFRSKGYANTGKVKELVIENGRATAKVAGHSRPWYCVSVRFKPLKKPERERLLAIVRGDPLLLPRIEAGELPGELVARLKAADVELIPKRWKDMERNCSCPDWGDPCKHMAAVYYLLAREIDQDPRILFALRGLELRDLELRESDPIEWRLAAKPEEGFIPLEEGESFPFPAGNENYSALIAALLPKETSFADGDFAASLIGLYHASARADYAATPEIDERVWRRHSSARYGIVLSEGRKAEPVPAEAPRVSIRFATGETQTIDLYEAADLFLSSPDGSGTAGCRYLYGFFRLLAALRRSGAFARSRNY